MGGAACRISALFRTHSEITVIRISHNWMHVGHGKPSNAVFAAVFVIG